MCRHSQAPPNFKFQDSHLETPSPRQSPWSTTPPASGPATLQTHTQSLASPAAAGPEHDSDFKFRQSSHSTCKICAKLGTNLRGHFHLHA